MKIFMCKTFCFKMIKYGLNCKNHSFQSAFSQGIIVKLKIVQWKKEKDFDCHISTFYTKRSPKEGLINKDKMWIIKQMVVSIAKYVLALWYTLFPHATVLALELHFCVLEQLSLTLMLPPQLLRYIIVITLL